MIDVDVETTGTQWYAHELFLVSFNFGVGGTLVLRHPSDFNEIQEILRDPDDFRAWNTKFDMHFLESAGYTLPPGDRWHDGMVEAHLVNENRSLALKAVAGSMFGEGERDYERAVKDWLNKEAARRRKVCKETGEVFIAPNYSDVPDELMLPYAEQDVLLTRAISEQYGPLLQGQSDLAGVLGLEREVTPMLYAAERRGIPVDREAAVRFEAELATKLDEIELHCIELAGRRDFNPNSSEQIHKALKRRGADLRFCTKTKTGVSMDAESLGTVDDELAREILAFRGEHKIFSTYLRPMLHESYDSGLRSTKAPFITEAGRIHPNFRQVGARTGRMSCSDPNIQNWPRDDLRLRYLFRAEPGRKLVAGDLEAVEYRLFAGYVGGSIKDAVLRGEDVHEATAKVAGLGDKRRLTGVETARQRGKTLNYAIMYGAGVRSLRKAFGVSQEEARAILRRYHAAHPEVSQLQRDMEWVLAKRGFVRTAYGRRQRLDPRESYRAVNYAIQGSAAEILKAAAVRLHKDGYPIVALVHDEIILDVEAGDAKEAAHDLEVALTDHPRITEKIPLSADVKIVNRWSEAKDPAFVPSFAC